MNEQTRHDSLLQLDRNLLALDKKVIDQSSFFIDILTSYLDSITLDYSIDIIAEDHLAESIWLTAYYADALFPHTMYNSCRSLLKLQLAKYHLLIDGNYNQRQKAHHLGRVITSEILIWVLAYYLQSQSANFVNKSFFIKKLFGELLSDWDDSHVRMLTQEYKEGLQLENCYVGAYYWGSYDHIASRVASNVRTDSDNECVIKATASYNFALFASEIVIYALGGYVDDTEQFYEDFANYGIVETFLEEGEDVAFSDFLEDCSNVKAEVATSSETLGEISVTSAQIDREIIQYYINDSLDRKDKESFMLWTDTLHSLNKIERGRKQTNEQKRA